MVYLNGQQLDALPRIDLRCAPRQERNDLLQAPMELREAALLDRRKISPNNQISDLEVIVAVDQDDKVAIVHIAQSVFRIGSLPRDAEPQNVDRHAIVDQREMG